MLTPFLGLCKRVPSSAKYPITVVLAMSAVVDAMPVAVAVTITSSRKKRLADVVNVSFTLPLALIVVLKLVQSPRVMLNDVWPSEPLDVDTVSVVPSLVVFHAPALKVRVAVPLTVKAGDVAVPEYLVVPNLIHLLAAYILSLALVQPSLSLFSFCVLAIEPLHRPSLPPVPSFLSNDS